MARGAGRVGEDQAPAELTTAVRAFTTRRPTPKKPRPEPEERPRWRAKRSYPHEALVFDTETYPGPAQNLRILVWRAYRDPDYGVPGTTCIEEGTAYTHDLPQRDPAGFQVLQAYVAEREADVTPGHPVELLLVPLSWWLDHRFFTYGYQHRDRCAIVGFNLLFDLGRLAAHWKGARGGRYRGGFSLGIWGGFTADGRWKDRKYRGRLQLRAIDPRRTLGGWASRGRKDPDPDRGAGKFVDLRTLAFALTDRSHSLESACKAFGDPYEKQDVDYDELTEELLD
jgi:hypothetical protein